jgi:hypothetical protein|tara:strand:+ start:1566 stop:1868 length:303 start_codon:yes stop_codon:yes gene_type:complete
MAKRKTPKKDTILDLNPKPEKIETEELNKIQSLIKGINKAQLQIGIVEVQKHNILSNIMEITSYLDGIKKEILEKYGPYDVNLVDGVINYNKDGSNEINS